jgi:hypothetical protein
VTSACLLLLQDALARITHGIEALEDGDTYLAAAILDGLAADLSAAIEQRREAA